MSNFCKKRLLSRADTQGKTKFKNNNNDKKTKEERKTERRKE